MLKESITIDDTIELLNQMLQLAPETVKHLIDARVSCNAALADHPAIQVRRYNTHKGTSYEIGILGILNGLFGADENGYAPIAVCANKDNGSIVQFRRYRKDM